ncbi:MAG TPA: hypothetical protein VLE20_01275 [Blastocatellia bacterium]|nr:hypothetical protein [Blastocatellia bacterium]
MRDEFADANFRVVCYLRRQDELLESEYNQHVKQGGVKDHRQFMSIMMPRLDYSRYLQVLQTAFGVRNIIVRVYEKAQLEGDLYDDFFRCLGLKVRSDYTRPGRPVNPSLSAAGLALMRLLNQQITDELLLKQLRRCVLQHYSSEPFKHEGTILSTRERHSLVERFAPSNAEIARQYMGRRDGTLFSDEIADIEAPAGPKEVCEPVVGLLEKHLSRRPYDTGARDALCLIRSAQPNHAFSHAPLLLDVDDSP